MALVSISAASERWGVSKFTTRRLIDGGYVRSVTISSRRLIPEDEVERVAREGAGKPRHRKGAKSARAAR
jgi:predicted site-specific integrase-resolvase